MARSELLVKVYLCPWRPASVLCTCSLSLVTKLTHFVTGNEHCDREINFLPIKIQYKIFGIHIIYVRVIIIERDVLKFLIIKEENLFLSVLLYFITGFKPVKLKWKVSIASTALGY